ncbi:flagellar export protein FliJ [Pseudomonas aeruginosa]
MKSHGSLGKLIEISQELLNDATVRLAESRRSEHAAKKLLDELRDYQRDYLEQMHEQMRVGMDALTASNYRDFLSALNRVIAQAEESVRVAAQTVEAKTSDWRDSHIKLNRFQTVQNSRQRELDEKVKRAEQKATDELSSQMHARRAHSFGFSR